MFSFKKNAVVASLLASLILLPTTANAALITQTIEFNNAQIWGDLNFDFSALSTQALGDVTFNFNVKSDLGDTKDKFCIFGYCIPNVYLYDDLTLFSQGLNNADEYVNLSIDGLDLGRWLDGDSNNDLLDNGADIGFAGVTANASYVMNAATFNDLIADSIFNISFDFSDDVKLFTPLAVILSDYEDFASVTVSYEGSDAQQNNQLASQDVPEPAPLALLGFAMLGLYFRAKSKAVKVK